MMRNKKTFVWFEGPVLVGDDLCLIRTRIDGQGRPIGGRAYFPVDEALDEMQRTLERNPGAIRRVRRAPEEIDAPPEGAEDDGSEGDEPEPTEEDDEDEE